MPDALAHLKFLTNPLLQDFGCLSVLHLHFPPLCQDSGFLIGQSIPELVGDLCLLLSPSKRTPIGISSGRKLKAYITTEVQIKTMGSTSFFNISFRGTPQ